MNTFRIQTFGCQMNVRDSQWLESALLERDFTKDEGTGCADIVILNTCSVREKPEQKVKNAILRISRTEPQVRLIVTLGCVAQQLGEKIFSVAPEARLVAGSDNLHLIPDAIGQLLVNPQDKLSLLEFSPRYPERALNIPQRQSVQGMVAIMQGCDNFCAYCIVPFTRGRQKSRRRETILAECAAWLDAGAADITLLGQNVNVWDGGFSSLLRDIAALPGLRRLRFVTPHPAFMTDEVVACFADLPNLAPRLHLPLQSGSDRVLKAMGRRHNRTEYLDLAQRLRAARPDLALSTDLIVGFPGESEDDFQETLAMVEQCAFMSGFSFCYSDRPGTRASLMPAKLPQEVKLERLSRLQAQLDAQGARWLRKRVGSEAEILLECRSPRGGNDSWQGRDIYGSCVNVQAPGATEGQFLMTRITGARKHSLVGEVIGGSGYAENAPL